MMKRFRETRFLPADDVLLRDALGDGLEVDEVARRAAFSQRFTPNELAARWRALIFNAAVASRSNYAVAHLATNAAAAVAWDPAEDACLRAEAQKVDADDGEGLDFPRILHLHRFHQSRTALALEARHWELQQAAAEEEEGASSGGAALLRPPPPPPPPRGFPMSNLHRAWTAQSYEEIEADAILSLADGGVERGATLAAARRAQFAAYGGLAARRRTERLDSVADAVRDQLLLDGTRGSSSGTPALAWLRGLRTLHSMTTREVLLGRGGDDRGAPVDVSLCVEAEDAATAARLSRASAVIKLKRSGGFELKNVGTRTFTVNGVLIQCGTKVKLESQSVLTFGRGVTLVFLINHTFAADLARTMTSM
jgi:hypothetical protein